MLSQWILQQQSIRLNHVLQNLKILDYEIASEQYGVGFAKGNDAVKDQVQKTLEEMAADGTLAKISTKWFGEDITTIGK